MMDLNVARFRNVQHAKKILTVAIIQVATIIGNSSLQSFTIEWDTQIFLGLGTNNDAIEYHIFCVGCSLTYPT